MRKHTRTLIIPKGILDGNVTNVVMIPTELGDPNRSLVVRAPALDKSLPFVDRKFMDWQPQRKATSLHGTPARPHQSDHFDSDFDPYGVSSFQEYVDDDYYFDMYDTDNDDFVGGDSGNLSGSVLERLMGGELNRISGAEEVAVEARSESLQPVPFMIESPISSFHDSRVDSGGYEASSEPYVMSNYTPLSQSISIPDANYVWPPLPTCEPCFPANGGNFDLCPETCPVRRGIPFGDPNRPADEFSDDEIESPQQTPASLERSGPILAGTPPFVDRTRSPAPTPFLDVTRPLNTTMPVVSPVNLNRTRPMEVDLNRTLPMEADLNRTRPIAVDLNVTRPMGGEARILNTTGPVVSPSASRINLNVTVELLPSNAVASSASRSRIPLPMNPATPMVQRVLPQVPFTGYRGRPQQQLLQVPSQQPRPMRPPQQPPRQQQLPRQQLQPRQQQRPGSSSSRGRCIPCSGRPPWR